MRPQQPNPPKPPEKRGVVITEGTTPPDDDGRKAFADRSDRFPADQRLRRHNFTIAGRPTCGPASWKRNGLTVTEAEAHKAIDRELASVEKGQP